MTKHVRCLPPANRSIWQVWLVPQCECWKMRPRWTVIRSWLVVWKCADCGKRARVRFG